MISLEEDRGAHRERILREAANSKQIKNIGPFSDTL
jgi:hypothetical protein